MSAVFPAPHSEAGYLNQDGEGRTVMAEVPVTISPTPKKPKQQTPQQAIDDFWAKFTTKAPGKATTVIPHNEYAEKAAKRSAKAVGTNTQTSYEEAAAVCKAKVAKIVKECRRVNQKYRDPHFDLESDLKWGSRDTLESLSNIEDKPDSDFSPKSVKRVVDIFDDPKFYIEGPTANDVRQGRDGDCWLLAALCTLSNKPSLIERVCVARDEQVGVYGFVFHRDGEWISEIIDDKLFLTKPDFDESFLERMLWEDRERINSEEQYRKAYQSGSGALYFAQCEHENETWLPLLEKAYAKAHGDYTAIEGGYTGEGIEDLTGGVTSELYASDILDKEYFWKEELMKVNDEFLFGCSTGMWGVGWGERKGIVELHAYSIMKAVDIDGHRLVLLKNPWGKGEWKGAWADGSKEWTAEWLLKLNHRFGDDGNFWISYDDLLRKYQAFDRTRLFGPEWKVTSLWTTLSIPWTLDYHDTYFDFSLAKAGPVVIVLSQLDDRYYRGLEGQYRFELNFRLHKNGQEDYVVRSINPYCQNRSVNVELELEEGEYTVLLKINATRYMSKLPIEEVVRNNARDRRDKLVAVGMSYDLAHSKGKIIETPEEKKARKEAEKRKKEKERQEFKKKIMQDRKNEHYLHVKVHKKNQEIKAKAKAKAQAKKAAKAEKLKFKMAAEEAKGSKEQQPEPDKEKHVQVVSPSQTPEPESKEPGSESITDPKIETPSTEPSKTTPEPDKTSTDVSPKSEEQLEVSSSGEIIGSVKVEDNVDLIKGPAESKGESPKLDEDDKSQEKGESQDDEESSSDESDILSVSEISDRELDIRLERQANEPTLPSPPPPVGLPDEEEDEFESNPWNAVTTVGLRVYYKVVDEDKDKEIVKLRVVRPNPYADDKKDKDDSESDKDDDEDDEEDIADGKQNEPKSSKGLDVDDSSKDATLEGDNEQRRKSILSLIPTP
ncbi:cysteine proteinase [Annulohypoxylon maeteangense]|uniref:cysteine proteinase n=1 Tax=Annulohypoxylon maeteangense TaxID=1927788 RepID=UPI002007C322|nr:cysteine proteinase [Annulohypoxylon maeteangense]KAI0880645.1 cysteine proteinase [Annulohypoxylon maeteangense]